MVLSEESSNRNKAATVVRAKARSRRGVKRSETAVSEKMVGNTGIEPVTSSMSTRRSPAELIAL